MQKIKTLVTKNIYLIFLLIGSIWLRIVNLGYSDYQGDEIKALFSPSMGQTAWEYLLEQRKGPVQFLITYFVSLFDPTFLNQFLFRLPFALAGILCVLVFYKTVEMHFGKKIALYSATFFSVNGILVAFSRIVQYQTVTILFSLLALYFVSLAIKVLKWKIKGLYFASTLWAFSILSHFDGGFIAPVLGILLIVWFKKSDLSVKEKIKHIVLSGLIFVVLLGLFFIPYALSLDSSTVGYWKDRLSGGFGRTSSSQLTFKVYNPLFVLFVFCLFAAISIFNIKKSWPLYIWIIFPLFVWEFLTEVPGTHIYNYLIPLFILSGIGISYVQDKIKVILKLKVFEYLFCVSLIFFFSFWFLMSSAIFVDHKQEYPWENEKFFRWTFNVPNHNYHLSLFGFPYFRDWEGISDYVASSNNGYYSTNERPSISRFYVPLNKSTDRAGHYITIVNPQSYSPEQLNAKAIYWAQKYQPDKIIEKDGKTLVKIYIMPEGNLDVITSSGY